MIKWWKVTMAIILVSIVASLAINYAYSVQSPFGINIVNSNDWIGFWGSIMGATIGGSITLIGLKITLKNEREKEEENHRLHILPYLKFTYKDIKECNDIKDKIDYSFTFAPKGLVGELKPDVLGIITVENIGLNAAIDFSVLEASYDNLHCIERFQYPILQPNKKIYLQFWVIIPDREKIINNDGKPEPGNLDIPIRIAYSNILGDYYEQELELSCGWSTSYYSDEYHNISNIEYFYGAGIDVKKSKLYKDRKIETERRILFDNFINKNKNEKRSILKKLSINKIIKKNKVK